MHTGEVKCCWYTVQKEGTGIASLFAPNVSPTAAIAPPSSPRVDRYSPAGRLEG